MRQMTKSHSDHPTFITPREFGFILSCCGETHQLEMTAIEQLSMANRIVEVAMQRLRLEKPDAELEGQEKVTNLG